MSASKHIIYTSIKYEETEIKYMVPYAFIFKNKKYQSNKACTSYVCWKGHNADKINQR